MEGQASIWYYRIAVETEKRNGHKLLLSSLDLFPFDLQYLPSMFSAFIRPENCRDK